MNEWINQNFGCLWNDLMIKGYGIIRPDKLLSGTTSAKYIALGENHPGLSIPVEGANNMQAPNMKYIQHIEAKTT